MKIGIMQPYFFPYLGYWQTIKAVNKFVVYVDVNYIKGGWVNRNNILVNGNAHLITLALKDASPNKKINEIEILDSFKNKTKILSSIRNSYSRAPYFQNTFKLLEDIINFQENNLGLFLFNQIMAVSSFLNLNTELILSSEINNEKDLKADTKVIQICNHLKGVEYINAIGGQDLYSKKVFKNNNIDLYFIKMGDIKYNQNSNQFISNLSIIDLLMFNSKDEVNRMLDNFELI